MNRSEEASDEFRASIVLVTNPLPISNAVSVKRCSTRLGASKGPHICKTLDTSLRMIVFEVNLAHICIDRTKDGAPNGKRSVGE